MASAFPSSGFFAGGSWAAERLTAATHMTATVSTENIHLISGSSLQKRVYTTFARERATKTKIRYSQRDRKSTRLNSSHTVISYAVFCLKKKNQSKYE